MKINNTSQAMYIEKVYADNKNSINKKDEKRESSGKDRIEMSKEMQDVKKYSSYVTEPEVDATRINHLKRLIEKGEYKVSSEELTNKMIESMKN